MKKEKQILCDFKDCTAPAVMLKFNRNFCVIHQYGY